MITSYFSKNLKTLRRHYGYSQEKLAQLLHIGRNKIASYEGRAIEPKLSLLVEISRLFKVSVEDLIASELSMENIPIYINKYEHIQSHQHDSSQKAAVSHVSKEKLEALDHKLSEVERIAQGFESYLALDNEIDAGQHQSGVTTKLLRVLNHLINYNKMFINESIQN